MVSILDYLNHQASGDLADAFREAFAAGQREFEIPAGKYALKSKLCLYSGTKIVASPEAEITAERGAYNYGAAIENVDKLHGNEDISIEGGVWNGGCLNMEKRSGYKDEYFIGVLFSFVRVTRLNMSKMTIGYSVSYHIRLGQVTWFNLSDIHFDDGGDARLCPMCQDGIHLGGGCFMGKISRITATKNSMGDDFICLNADDVPGSQNGDMFNDHISYITVEDVSCDSCYTGVRLLSIWHDITNVTFRRMHIGFRAHGLNLDAARYCADPQFRDEDYPCGVGHLHNVRFEDVELWSCAMVPTRELVTYETNGTVTFKNFRRLRANEAPEITGPTFRLKHLGETTVYNGGESSVIPAGETTFWDGDEYPYLEIRTQETFRNA